MYSLRDEEDIDLSATVKAFESMSIESNYGVTFSVRNTVNYVCNVVYSPEHKLISVYDKDVLCGVAVCARSNDLQEEYVGFVTKFYVLPRYRGTMTSRLLAAECTKWFMNNACIYSFVDSSAEIGNPGLLPNVFGKFGWEKLTNKTARKRYE